MEDNSNLISKRKESEDKSRSFISKTSIMSKKRQFFEAIKLRDFKKVIEFYRSNEFKAYDFIDSEGNNGLFLAIKEESIDLAITIIKELELQLDDLTFVKYLNTPTHSGLTLIHEAAVLGNIEIIDYLVQNGATLTTKNSVGLNALHIACQEDRINLVIHLVENHGLEVIDLDNRGSMPLHWACYFGSENSARYLTSKLCKISYKTYEETILNNNKIEIVENEEKRNDRINSNFTVNSSNYYNNNSSRSNYKLNMNVKAPLNKNLLNSVDFDGHSFLHLTAASRKLSLLKFMIMSGVDISIKDNKGRTVLDYCIEKDFEEEVNYLESLDKICNYKTINPAKKPKKSNINIYLFFILHIIFESLLFIYIFPCKIKFNVFIYFINLINLYIILSL